MAILGFLGGSQGSPFSRHFRVFLGLGGKFAAATPLLVPILIIFDDLGCFGACFLMIFEFVFVNSVVFFWDASNSD